MFGYQCTNTNSIRVIGEIPSTMSGVQSPHDTSKTEEAVSEYLQLQRGGQRL